jgi:hypothetical protein
MHDEDRDRDKPEQEAELRALILAHEIAFRRMIEQLDRADAALDHMMAHFAEKTETP